MSIDGALPDHGSLEEATLAFLVDPRSRRDPYPFLRRLQRDAPLQPTGFRSHLITRFDDVVEVLGAQRFALASRRHEDVMVWPSSTMARYFGGMLSMRDGADHSRLLGLVAMFFTSRRAELYRLRLTTMIAGLLSDAAERGRMDIVCDLARDLPVNVSCELLDIPEPDRAMVRDWSELLSRQIMAPEADGSDRDVANAETERFASYIVEIAAQRRSRLPEDILGTLAAACATETISRDELASFGMLLLISGSVTATHLLGNLVLLLLTHPVQLERVRADRALVPAAVDEALRFESPVRLVARTATEDTEIAGGIVRRGDVALTVLAAANRDPRRFANADRFEVARVRGRHLGFGHGSHFCLGHTFGRLAAEIVLDQLCTRFTHLELMVEEPDLEWSPSLVFRGLESLPVALEPR